MAAWPDHVPTLTEELAWGDGIPKVIALWVSSPRPRLTGSGVWSVEPGLMRLRLWCGRGGVPSTGIFSLLSMIVGSESQDGQSPKIKGRVWVAGKVNGRCPRGNVGLGCGLRHNSRLNEP